MPTRGSGLLRAFALEFTIQIAFGAAEFVGQALERLLFFDTIFGLHARDVFGMDRARGKSKNNRRSFDCVWRVAPNFAQDDSSICAANLQGGTLALLCAFALQLAVQVAL